MIDAGSDSDATLIYPLLHRLEDSLNIDKIVLFSVLRKNIFPSKPFPANVASICFNILLIVVIVIVLTYLNGYLNTSTGIYIHY